MNGTVRMILYVNPGKLTNDSFLKKSTEKWRKVGISEIHLEVWQWGNWKLHPDKIKRIKSKLEKEGFETSANIMPLGHAGVAVEHGIKYPIPEFPSHWHSQVSINSCVAGDSRDLTGVACPLDGAVRKDILNAVKEIAAMGFKDIYIEDDLRYPFFGGFCNRCLSEFNRRYNYTFTREELRKVIESNTHPKNPQMRVKQEFYQFRDNVISEMISAIRKVAKKKKKDIRIGYGFSSDGYDGDNVQKVISAIGSDGFVRVVEENYDDRAFNTDRKYLEFSNIHYYLSYARKEKRSVYSETTVFPVDAVSPLNLRKKIELALAAGLKDLFVYSDWSLQNTDYWKMLGDSQSRFCKIAKLIPLFAQPYAAVCVPKTDEIRLYSDAEYLTDPFLAWLWHANIGAINVRFNFEELKRAALVVISGANSLVGTLSDWKNLLSAGVPILVEAEALVRRRFDPEWLSIFGLRGVEVCKQPTVEKLSENEINGDFASSDFYITGISDGVVALLPNKPVESLGEFYDWRIRKIGHSIVFHQSDKSLFSLTGYNYLTDSSLLRNPKYLFRIHSLVYHLTRGRLPLEIIGAWDIAPLIFKRFDNEFAVCIVNFEHISENVTLRVNKKALGGSQEERVVLEDLDGKTSRPKRESGVSCEFKFSELDEGIHFYRLKHI